MRFVKLFSPALAVLFPEKPAHLILIDIAAYIFRRREAAEKLHSELSKFSFGCDVSKICGR